jgi:hypothetical protein
MMKRFLIVMAILAAIPPVYANQKYQPFTYETSCALETPSEFLIDMCKVVETREPSGALRSRNIFSNRFKLTIKSWFDKKRGFVTWDSHNKYEYKWEYKTGVVEGPHPWSYVMPGVLLQDVSWD